MARATVTVLAPVALATMVAACGDSSPAGTQVDPASTVGGAGQPQGFGLVAAEVTAADGDVCQLCLWLAETDVQRSRGLMGVTDLGPADGMMFLYQSPSTGTYWMRDTPMPLSIAFLSGGVFVSSTDMAPCLDSPEAGCPVYGAAGPFTAAVEVPTGQLDELGIAEGSQVEVLTTPCSDVGE